MPVFNFLHWSKDVGYHLAETGPIIAVEVSVPAALAKYLGEKALPIPSPVGGFALIDTGAFATAVDEKIFTGLGVQQIDTISTQSPHGDSTSNVYPCRVTFPGLGLNELAMERVVGCNLKWTTTDGREIIMLLGRDLLRYFLLVYNGLSNDITISY